MKTIRPADLEDLIARHEKFHLIDVRSPEEFAKAHIPGARSIPLWRLQPGQFLQGRKCLENAPVYLICRSRALAGLASGALEAAGCTNVAVVDGGMEVWEAEERPVIRRRKAWRINLDLPTLAVLSGLGLGLGLVVHPGFLILSGAAGLVGTWQWLSSPRQRSSHIRAALSDTKKESTRYWELPHVADLAAHQHERENLLGTHHYVHLAAAR